LNTRVAGRTAQLALGNLGILLLLESDGLTRAAESGYIVLTAVPHRAIFVRGGDETRSTWPPHDGANVTLEHSGRDGAHD
jgi:hypothetical protein